MSAGWYRTGLRKHRRVRQVPPQGTWCQDAWFPAVALTGGRHLPRCPLGCKLAGAGKEIPTTNCLPPYGRSQRRNGLDAQIPDNGKIMCGHAPAHSLIRCGRARDGIAGDSSLRGAAPECIPQPREPAPRTIAESRSLPALVDALSLFQTGTNKIPAGGSYTLFARRKAMRARGCAADWPRRGVCAPLQARSRQCQPLETDMDRQERRPEPPFWDAATSCPAGFDRREAMS
jgi:hypothetical protein